MNLEPLSETPFERDVLRAGLSPEVVKEMQSLFAKLPSGEYRPCAASGGKCKCGYIHSIGADMSVLTTDMGELEDMTATLSPDERQAMKELVSALLTHGPEILRRVQF